MRFTVATTIAAQQRLSKRLIRQGKTLAVVPTMGYLHDGHLSLIKKGLQKADIVVTTIFVNPTQFAPTEDLTRYPRDEKGDLEKIRQAGGQIVFIPHSSDMYPDDYETYVEVERLTKTLEGSARPTHFKGVTTIVTKLFHIIQPDFAMFGMKDFQQAIVISKMTKDLNWPTKIIVCPTVREKDGLAMSSRNSYLSDETRRQATSLYRALIQAKTLARNGARSATDIKKSMISVIRTVAPEAKIDYIAFTDMRSLQPRMTIEKNTVASLAVFLGSVRLIDNMKLL